MHHCQVEKTNGNKNIYQELTAVETATNKFGNSTQAAVQNDPFYRQLVNAFQESWHPSAHRFTWHENGVPQTYQTTGINPRVYPSRAWVLTTARLNLDIPAHVQSLNDCAQAFVAAANAHPRGIGSYNHLANTIHYDPDTAVINKYGIASDCIGIDDTILLIEELHFGRAKLDRTFGRNHPDLMKSFFALGSMEERNARMLGAPKPYWKEEAWNNAFANANINNNA